jgi:hypothetical protein
VAKRRTSWSRDGDVVDVPTSAVKVVPWGVWKAVKELVYVGGSVALF